MEQARTVKHIRALHDAIFEPRMEDIDVLLKEIDRLTADLARAEQKLKEAADVQFMRDSTSRALTDRDRIIAMLLRRSAGSISFTALEMVELPRDNELHFERTDMRDGGFMLVLKKTDQ